MWKRAPKPPPPLEGCLDNARDGMLRGWAWDPGDPKRFVAVDLFIDGEYVKSVVASEFREDLAGAKKREGHCSFETELPEFAYDGKPHRLEAFYYGTTTALYGSPIEAALDRPMNLGARGRGRHSKPKQPTVHQRTPPKRTLSSEDAERFRTARQGDSGFSGISLVMPTHGRASTLEASLRAWTEVRRPCDVEIVVVDDGSTDDTAVRLRRLEADIAGLRWRSVPQGGPAKARNAALAMARHDLAIIVGDDTRPASKDFFEHHLHAHRTFPSPDVAVLGKVVWPSADEHLSFVMTHIQGAGEEQFGYFHTLPYSWLDWRFFYTSNVSIKRSVVADWERDGFSGAFPLASFEDAEFAYRLTKRPGDFRVLYYPAATVTHHHPYSVKQFLRRQINCGLMAKIFEDLHPEVVEKIATREVREALAAPLSSPPECAGDYLAMLEGLKAWPAVIEQDQALGSQNWHADLLGGVFRAAYLQGRVMAADDPGANHAAAYRYILDEFFEHMSGAASYEALGRILALTVS
ncbi:MAG: glycosyltransferase [Bryobacteraceae bacterium]